MSDTNISGTNISGINKSGNSGLLDPHLFDVLVCPVCHGPLSYDHENNRLISKQAGLAYPIRDGVPVMLESEAAVLEEN